MTKQSLQDLKADKRKLTGLGVKFKLFVTPPYGTWPFPVVVLFAELLLDFLDKPYAKVILKRLLQD